MQLDGLDVFYFLSPSMSTGASHPGFSAADTNAHYCLQFEQLAAQA